MFLNNLLEESGCVSCNEGLIFLGLVAVTAAVQALLNKMKHDRNLCSGLSGKEQKKCQIQVYQDGIKALQLEMSKCHTSKNPEKCKKYIQKEIDNIKFNIKYEI